MFPIPLIKQILHYRSLKTLIGTFVEKLPNLARTIPDGKIHCSFKSIGAATGRMSSADPKKAYWGRKIGLIQGRAAA
jgi:DNA polymerase I-like protein with 3'-5' exonuclease and polymerase domains